MAFHYRFTSDNGSNFVSKEFRTYLRDKGINFHNVTPYWPQANGQVERLNRVFLKSFRAAVVDGKKWQDKLVHFLHVYRTTPQVSTGLAPATVLFGRDVRGTLPSITLLSRKHNAIVSKAYKHNLFSKLNAKVYADEKRSAGTSSVAVGDLVLVRQIRENKLQTSFSTIPWKVQIMKDNACVLQNAFGTFLCRHLTHLRKWKGQQEFFVGVPSNVSDCDDDESDDPVVAVPFLEGGENGGDVIIENQNEQLVDIVPAQMPVEQPRYNLRQEHNMPAHLKDYVVDLKK